MGGVGRRCQVLGVSDQPPAVSDQLSGISNQVSGIRYQVKGAAVSYFDLPSFNLPAQYLS